MPKPTTKIFTQRLMDEEDGPPTAIVMAYGKQLNWGTRSDESGRWVENLNSLHLAAALAARKGATDIFCPQANTFTGKVASRESFSLRSDSPPGIRIMEGVFADGVALQPGDALRLTNADCPAIVVHNFRQPPDMARVAAAHAGRDCLLDRRLILKKVAGRPKFSVVDNLMACFPKDDPEDLEVNVFMAIRGPHFPHDFHHPTHGETNQRIIEYLRRQYPLYADTINPEPSGQGLLDLPSLIKAQFCRFGIPLDQILCHDIDPYTHPHSWSCRREQETSRGNPLGRNLILIIRRGPSDPWIEPR